ncbi:MAG TPA: GntR family transcriptional regulator [Streptosporangiaceae bacterium]|jgi:GntR family transcriptional regulator
MDTEPTAGTVPVHFQIADAIRARITLGELSPGDSIPTIEELAEQWRCSPGSARSALAVLRGEGLITAGRGKAATVRHPPRRIRLPYSYGQQQKDVVLLPEEERSKGGAIELTAGIPIEETESTYRYSTVAAGAELAAEFGVSNDTELLRRDYEMTDPQTGHRLSLSTSYIPKSLIEPNADLFDEQNEPWPGGHQHQLYTVGIELDRIVRSVIAVEPTPGTRQRWGMDSGVPLLRVRSRSIDTNSRVVELSDATYPADRTELEFTEQLTPWPDDYPKYAK